MKTRPVLYRGIWWNVPVRVRNDVYCRARGKGVSHDDACLIVAYNWQALNGLGRIRAK